MGRRDNVKYNQPSYFEQLKQKHKKFSLSDSSGSAGFASTIDWTGRAPRMGEARKESFKHVDEMTTQDIEQAWAQVKHACSTDPRYLRKQQVQQSGQRRAGWKTVWLFVSSTFHDFQQERDLLVRKVFPDLKAWCQQNKIHFVEIDLRWGVPQGSDAEVALRTCLGEIERCYSDNGMPFFLNMLSERVGWVPTETQVPPAIRDEFEWVDGLSITEMEVVHGAMRSRNPNAFFLLRHPSFLNTVPEHKRGVYLDSKMPIAAQKVTKFREALETSFGDSQKVVYYARYQPEDQDDAHGDGYPVLTGFEDLVAEQVLNFFKARIAAQYPMPEDGGASVSEWETLTEMHEAFMRSEAGEIGKLPVWDKQVAHLVAYVEDDSSQVPYLLRAKSGSGKSSCLSTFITRLQSTHPHAKVFCHFVGAVSGSVNYNQMVKRIASFLGQKVDASTPFERVVQGVCKRLSTERDNTYVIVIDAYNQLTEPQVTWLPFPLSPKVKIVITARPESGVVELIQKNYARPLLSTELIPMDEEGKREMVGSILGTYNKRLDDTQMNILLSKQASSSYYWLSLTCEELRIFGHFEQLTEKIESLPDDLVDLQVQILKRIEDDQKFDELLVATLCFLLVSQSGLLEVELLELLAEPPHLLPPRLRANRYADKLPYKVWSSIMRDLRTFVKSIGDSSEGRLKIYHATFEKAVEKMYLQTENEDEESRLWFHEKLADYFSGGHSSFERQLEEYPYHLARLGHRDRLASFLCKWPAIDAYFKPE